MSGRIDEARVYFDTNVFIEAVEGRGTLRDKLSRLLVAVDRPERPHVVTSQLTLAELLVKPLESGRGDLVSIYDSLMVGSGYLEVVPVVGDVLRDSAELRARDKSLKLPDAIHLTTAIGTKCRYFLTNDHRLKGQFGVQILRLNEETVDMLLTDVADV